MTYTTSSSDSPVNFDWDVINPGGHYDNTTGYYTVPYDGIYQFHVQMQSYSSSYTIYIHIYVDGSTTGSHADSWSHDGYRSATVLLELEAGQVVSVYRYGGASGCSYCLHSYFSGYMISSN